MTMPEYLREVLEDHPVMERIERKPRRKPRRAEDVRTAFWKLVDGHCFGASARTMTEGERIDLMTIIGDTAWRMQFGGGGRDEAFAGALAARGYDLPGSYDEWIAVLVHAPDGDAGMLTNW